MKIEKEMKELRMNDLRSEDVNINRNDNKEQKLPNGILAPKKSSNNVEGKHLYCSHAKSFGKINP